MTDTVAILEDYSRRHYGLPFVFPNIAIETTSMCNRGCSFCPVGHARKPVTRMKHELFDRIVAQLAAIHYRGDICLQWYNEPLADRRLPAWTAACRAACPHSFIYVNSNGDFLTQPLFDSLVTAGMDRIQVSQYDGHIQENVQAVLDAGRHLDRLQVGLKGAAELTNTRGGTVAHLTVNDQPIQERCTRPDEQLIVDASGNVPLCCNDYHVSHRIGSAWESTLLELWTARKFEEARRAVRGGDRSQIQVCRACNEPDVPYAQLLPKGRA